MPQDYTYFVNGKLHARAYGSSDPFLFVGLVDDITLSVAQQQITLPDRTQSGGGNYKDLRRIESVSVQINHREFYPTVLARALFGSSTLVNGAAVAAEEHVAYKGGFIPLDHPGPYTLVTITDVTDPSDPQVVADTNYTVSKGGIQIHEDAADVTDEDVLSVAYTHPDYNRVQALVQGAPELEFFFDGVNEAVDDAPRPVRIYRVRLGAAETVALLSGDDFGALPVNGEVLKDTTKVGQGLSQYFYTDIPVDA